MKVIAPRATQKATALGVDVGCISWVNETSELNSAPTDSPRWMRLIASPMSGATDSTLILGLCFDAGSGTVSVMITSLSEELAIRSIAGSDRTPWVAHA